MQASPIRYFAFAPRAEITMRDVDITAKVGSAERVSSWAPDYADYHGHAFVFGKMAGRAILCIPEILALAKAKQWTGVRLTALANGNPRYECNYRGKITLEDTAHHPSDVDDYYVSEDVIAADLVRAREMAAEMLASPDLPEYTSRSFEIVRKALIEAPHTLGYPDTRPTKPKPVPKPGAPLIDPKDIKRLKLKGDSELRGEIPLGHPLCGSEMLNVVVSDEISSDDGPEEPMAKAEMKRHLLAALEKFESRLPAVEAALDARASAYEKTPEEFRAALHEPALYLCTEDLAKGGDRWSFIVEDEHVGHHFEFDGDKLIEAWSGD
jgi:hypothetical protein